MAVGVGSLVTSVMPYLMMAVQSNKDTTFLTVRNAGIGPALLDDVRVRYKGKDFALDPHDFFVQQRPEFDKTSGMSVDKLISGRLIPAGEWIQTMGTKGAEPGVALLEEMLPLFVIAEVPKAWLTIFGGADVPASDKAAVFITYSSVYGEQWHLRSVPVPGSAPGAAQ
jgi:hypothetical protein